MLAPIFTSNRNNGVASLKLCAFQRLTKPKVDQLFTVDTILITWHSPTKHTPLRCRSTAHSSYALDDSGARVPLNRCDRPCPTDTNGAVSVPAPSATISLRRLFMPLPK